MVGSPSVCPSEMLCWDAADGKCPLVHPLTCYECHRGFPVTAVPLAAVVREACEAAVSLQSQRAPCHVSASGRRVLHRAWALQWLLTWRFLVHSGVQLMIGKTGELLSFPQAVPLAIVPSVTRTSSLRLYSFPGTRRSVPFEEHAIGDA